MISCQFLLQPQTNVTAMITWTVLTVNISGTNQTQNYQPQVLPVRIPGYTTITSTTIIITQTILTAPHSPLLHHIPLNHLRRKNSLTNHNSSGRIHRQKSSTTATPCKRKVPMITSAIKAYHTKAPPIVITLRYHTIWESLSDIW